MPCFAKTTASVAKTTASVATTKMCAYEKERLANIARNRERMAALGVLDAARDIAHAAHAERLAEREKRAALTTAATASGRQIAAARSAARPRVATRRSGRLSGSAPILRLDNLRDGLDALGDAYTAETYTAAHRAALGSAATPWTLFVDGYDESGVRIYDKGPNGRTCHQCRQKTVCKHTSCGACGAARGQFCGDCLFMRYGENVDEVARDAAWRCPSCRDLCNCSFCRQKKGWPPTGSMYRRAIKEGFQSVAHYLVLGGERVAAGENADSPEGAETAVSVSVSVSGSLGKDAAVERPVSGRAEHAFKKAPRSRPPVPPVSGKTRSVNALHAPAPETPGRGDASRARKRLRREA
jgi:hypothetical protein